MAYSVVIATTPLLAEEDFAGTTFSNLRASNPRLADVIWHDAVAFGVLSFGAAAVVFLLSWKGLSRGSPVAWTGLLIVAIAVLGALLIAHVPVGNTGLIHIGPAAVLLAVSIVALAASAKPALSIRTTEAAKVSRRTTAGRALVAGAGIIFMVLAVGIALTPLPGEEDFAGTTFANLRATSPRLADVIWHDYVGFGILLFGVSFLIVFLAWKGFGRDSVLAWTSLLLLGLTILSFLVLAHFPVGNTGLLHIGPPLVFAAVLLIGVALLASPVLGRKRAVSQATT